MTTVTRAFLRYLLRRPSLSILQFLGIAAGVASAVGMSLSARTALDSFAQAVDFLRGRATHFLERPAGPLDETLLTRLIGDPAVEAFSPVVDRRIELADGERVRVLGVDPFLDFPFRSGLAPPEGEATDFLLEARVVLADRAVAARLGYREGGDPVSVATSHGALRIVGVFANPSAQPLFVMDIAQAQEVFDLRGRVDHVDLILTQPEAFLERWDQGFVVRSSGQGRDSTRQMLRAFRLNLEALSLLGLFVGVFLVYNTAMFAVVSRKRDAGILVALGAERREIAGAFLAELSLLGAVGGLLGAWLGFQLSRLLTGLLAGAISNLYFFLRPSPPQWSWGVAGVGVLLGVAACLLGGAFPLGELLRTDPIRALQGRVVRRGGIVLARRSAWVGLALAGLSVALFPPATLHVYAGFAGAFGLLLGFSLMSGAWVGLCGPVLERLWQRLAGLPGRLAAGNIRRNLGRTAVAVAAFAVALSMSVGMGLMIGSFRRTMVWWMEGQLTGEVYVAPSAEIEVPTAFYERVRELPGIGVDAYRNAQILYGEAPVYVTAVVAEVLQRFADFGWRSGGLESWDAVRDGEVIVSESFSRRFRKSLGDTVELEGQRGPVEFVIAGVFYDYTTEHGLVMMDRSTYQLVFGDTRISSLGIFVEPGSPEGEASLALVREWAKEVHLPVRDRADLHADILEVFDATFAVTRSMRLLAVVVSFFGIAGALLTLYLERQREFGIYRALGFSTGQVAWMTLLEGMGMGLISLVASLGLGSLLALVLIRVINLESFHWTIFFHVQAAPYLTAAAVALAASAGAAAYPIWKVCRTYPQMQIREE